jgi:hypothetical protein
LIQIFHGCHSVAKKRDVNKVELRDLHQTKC